LDIRRIATLKDREEATGNQVRVKVVKNKIAPPFKQVEFDIMFGEGISKVGELIDLGVKAGIVENQVPGSRLTVSVLVRDEKIQRHS
jgi:recombination protein RecA